LELLLLDLIKDLFIDDKEPFIEAEHQDLMRQREEYATGALVWFISFFIRIMGLSNSEIRCFRAGLYIL